LISSRQVIFIKHHLWKILRSFKMSRIMLMHWQTHIYPMLWTKKFCDNLICFSYKLWTNFV
jgi:hypothetical protein